MRDGATSDPTDAEPADAEAARLRRELDAARDSAARLRAILESATEDAIITTDERGLVTSWNAGATNLLGWEEAEAAGLDASLIFTPEDRERGAPEAEMAAAARAGRATDERWHMRKDGSRFWGSGVLLPLRDGAAPGYLKVLRDRTALRTAQGELAAAHARASAVLESIADAFYAIDGDWRLTYVNRRAEELWRIPREGLLGRTLWEVFPHADLRSTEAYRLHEQAARERRPVHAEVLSAALGIWVTVSIYPHAEGEGGLSVYFRDISERKEAERRQGALLRELSHRVKNTLALVAAMARQSGRRSADLTDFLEGFEGRLAALAAAHELLTESGWRSIPLPALARAALTAHAPGGEGRIALDLADLPLAPAAAQNVVLVLHELATNAAKHGSLSVPEGRVAVEGRVAGDQLVLAWRESGGPPVRPPASRGFGTTLLERVVAYQHDGRAELDWRPEGLACTLRLPLAQATGRAPS